LCHHECDSISLLSASPPSGWYHCHCRHCSPRLRHCRRSRSKLSLFLSSSLLSSSSSSLSSSTSSSGTIQLSSSESSSSSFSYKEDSHTVCTALVIVIVVCDVSRKSASRLFRMRWRDAGRCRYGVRYC
jgi:hypothetical protein